MIEENNRRAEEARIHDEALESEIERVKQDYPILGEMLSNVIFDFRPDMPGVTLESFVENIAERIVENEINSVVYPNSYPNSPCCCNRY